MKTPSFVLILFIILFSCKKNDSEISPMFKQLSTDQTNIDFQNTLKDDFTYNIINYLYYYNGGGVAVGDINNDDLVDIFFTSNTGDNKLYINLGNLKFKDISSEANIKGVGTWSTGVTMVDINADGLLDIYVCNVGGHQDFTGKNELFINNGDLTFTESASKYGLDFEGYASQAAFFDYDLDGDMDAYLLNHSVHTAYSYGKAEIRNSRDLKAGDRLMQNVNGNFVDVSEEAGIYGGAVGYGLAIGISDVNEDNWPDIYISNDFHENDYLYINQQDRTFKEKITQATGHTSRFSMGNDISDLNNDLRPDIISLDMLPQQESIIKESAGEDPYDIYEFKIRFGYHYQNARNALQINRGNSFFSEAACLAGLEATDWSWGPLIADFDQDGLKDIFITNGIPKRPNNLDYINFISNEEIQRGLAINDSSVFQKVIKKMPQGHAENYAFRNMGEMNFEDVSSDWGLDLNGLSNGSAYADLDNDGDLDLVVNNINQKATVYENMLSEKNYLKVTLEDTTSDNRFGIGSKVYAYSAFDRQLEEVYVERGWLSSVEPSVYLTLQDSVLDSLVIIWPDRSKQILNNVKMNQSLTITKESHPNDFKISESEYHENALFDYKHIENNYVDFNHENFIPHKISTEGPKMACADINKDGIEDYYLCGAYGQAGSLYISHSGGYVKDQNQPHLAQDLFFEDVDATFFDADGDGDEDLFVVTGGSQFKQNDPLLTDRLYLNNGNGIFERSVNSIPKLSNNGSCVAIADFDKDNDLDIFIGSRSYPGVYGLKPDSKLLLNDGTGNFSEHLTAMFQRQGMVTDAEWVDVDNNGWQDLLIVGEWMPVTVFLNFNGRLEEADDLFEEKTDGWWNAIKTTDLDNDGDMDFIAGNLGKNSRLRATSTEPLTLLVGDFDDNGTIEQIINYYNQGTSYPFYGKDLFTQQMPELKKKYLYYRDFKTATINDIFSEEQLQNTETSYAYCLESSVFINDGKGHFQRKALPVEAQITVVYAIETFDYNNDGLEDIVLGGNRYGTRPEFGRYDAGMGCLLLNMGENSFKFVDNEKTGLYFHGEVRDIHVTPLGQIIVARNDDSLLTFKQR